MKKQAGRPKKETGKGAIVHPHIGGMETLGAKPVGGVTSKHKEGVVEKSTGHKGIGFGHALHTGVGGLRKKKS